MTQTFADSPPVPHGRSRALDQPVLSSAEEELALDTAENDTGASYIGTSDTPTDSAAGSLQSSREALSRYVQAQPLKAALVAMGAGALAALLLGRGSRSRRRRRD